MNYYIWLFLLFSFFFPQPIKAEKTDRIRVLTPMWTQGTVITEGAHDFDMVLQRPMKIPFLGELPVDAKITGEVKEELREGPSTAGMILHYLTHFGFGFGYSTITTKTRQAIVATKDITAEVSIKNEPYTHFSFPKGTTIVSYKQTIEIEYIDLFYTYEHKLSYSFGVGIPFTVKAKTEIDLVDLDIISDAAEYEIRDLANQSKLKSLSSQSLFVIVGYTFKALEAIGGFRYNNFDGHIDTSAAPSELGAALGKGKIERGVATYQLLLGFGYRFNSWF
ncbi:hypothetical protein WDW89_17795 [Deltaproteobacteria bacterium TL4]